MSRILELSMERKGISVLALILVFIVVAGVAIYSVPSLRSTFVNGWNYLTAPQVVKKITYATGTRDNLVPTHIRFASLQETNDAHATYKSLAASDKHLYAIRQSEEGQDEVVRVGETDIFLTSDGKEKHHLSASPDGRYVAWSSDGAIHVYSLDKEEEHTFPGKAPRFSSITSLTYLHEEGFAIKDVVTGNERIIPDESVAGLGRITYASSLHVVTENPYTPQFEVFTYTNGFLSHAVSIPMSQMTNLTHVSSDGVAYGLVHKIADAPARVVSFTLSEGVGETLFTFPDSVTPIYATHP